MGRTVSHPNWSGVISVPLSADFWPHPLLTWTDLFSLRSDCQTFVTLRRGKLLLDVSRIWSRHMADLWTCVVYWQRRRGRGQLVHASANNRPVRKHSSFKENCNMDFVRQTSGTVKMAESDRSLSDGGVAAEPGACWEWTWRCSSSCSDQLWIDSWSEVMNQCLVNSTSYNSFNIDCVIYIT